MTDPETLTEKVQAAISGEREAWNWLVDRYAPLVMGVASRYRLRAEDAADVSQGVWLKLVEHLDDIREPLALPGWIVTTTSREALRVLQSRQRTVEVDPQIGHKLEAASDAGSLDDELLRDERHHALREGLRELRPGHRNLLVLLLEDPPLSYAEISRKLGIPMGSIGPTRARCLEALRRTAAVRSLLPVSDAALRR
jgi:RNA polymerase sigma factor (sigma-70 family)